MRLKIEATWLAAFLLGACDTGSGGLEIVSEGSGEGKHSMESGSDTDSIGSPPSATGSSQHELGERVVAAGGQWRFLVADSAPAGWTQRDFDDSGWETGNAPLGVNARGINTVVPRQGGQVIYLRTRGADYVAKPGSIALLRMRRDDAAVVYVDGTHLVSSNVSEVCSVEKTCPRHEVMERESNIYVSAVADATAFGDGESTIAVEVHPKGQDDDDWVFDLELSLVDADEPAARWEATVSTLNYNGKYSPNQAVAYWIDRADGKFVKTLAVYADKQQEHLIHWRIASGDECADAETGATRTMPRTDVVRWDGTDSSGKKVPDGEYRLRVEIVEEHSNDGAEPGRLDSFSFSLGGNVSYQQLEPVGLAYDVCITTP